jgi:hypothetical protein
MAIESRTSLTIERRRRVNADLHGDGSVTASIGPQTPRSEYICLVIGQLPIGEAIGPAEVISAVRRLLATVDR